MSARVAAAVAAAAMIAAVPVHAAPGDAAVHYFDLPSTATALQRGGYSPAATLTMTEVTDGVEFLLAPNWGAATAGFAANSFVQRLEYVYKGTARPSFTFLGGAAIEKFEFVGDRVNLTGGYKTEAQYLEIEWSSSKKQGRFENPDVSRWKVSGVLTDFTGTQATSSSKPSPIFGVVAVSAYSLPALNPTPSQWAAAVSPVPEPESFVLMLAGLSLVVAYAARCRARSSDVR